MRYRVDFENDTGYASFDESDYERAMELYGERGIRLLVCKDIFDRGTLVFGAPVVEDLSRDRYDEN